MVVFMGHGLCGLYGFSRIKSLKEEANTRRRAPGTGIVLWWGEAANRGVSGWRL